MNINSADCIQGLPGKFSDDGGDEESTPPAPTPEAAESSSAGSPPSAPFSLSSPKIVNGKLRDAYDDKGQIVFPDIQWENPPSGTKSSPLIMENRGKDILAWYCGAPGPDKTGLSRGDFEALQNKAGISWTDVSKANSFRSGPSANYAEYLSIHGRVLKIKRALNGNLVYIRSVLSVPDGVLEVKRLPEKVYHFNQIRL